VNEAASQPGTATSTLVDSLAKGKDRVPVLPPLYAILELIIFFGIVAVLEWGVPSVGEIQEITPHPFWLVVLLLSLQYGTLSGLLAAFFAILMSYLIGWPEADINENHFSYLVRIWTQPVLWIAAALLIGQFRMRQLTQRAELRRALLELTQQRQLIAGHAEGLRRRCDELERQLAARPDPTGDTALAAFGALGAAPAEQLRAPFARVAEYVLHDACCSLFLIEAQNLVLQAKAGTEPQQAPTGRRAVFTPSDALYRAIVDERRSLSILDEQDEASLQGQGLIALPVELPSSGAIAGMLKVEFVSPAHLEAAFGQRLQLVAAQIGHALETQNRNKSSASDVAVGRSRTRASEHGSVAAAPVVPRNTADLVR